MGKSFAREGILDVRKLSLTSQTFESPTQHKEAFLQVLTLTGKCSFYTALNKERSTFELRMVVRFKFFTLLLKSGPRSRGKRAEADVTRFFRQAVFQGTLRQNCIAGFRRLCRTKAHYHIPEHTCISQWYEEGTMSSSFLPCLSFSWSCSIRPTPFNLKVTLTAEVERRIVLTRAAPYSHCVIQSVILITHAQKHQDVFSG